MRRLFLVLIALFATSCCCSSFSATTSSFLLGQRRNRSQTATAASSSEEANNCGSQQRVPSRSRRSSTGFQSRLQTDDDDDDDDIVHQFRSQSTRHAAALLFHCALVGAALPFLVIGGSATTGNLVVSPLVGAIFSVVLATLSYQQRQNPYGEWIQAVGMVLLSSAWQRYPAIRQQFPTMQYIRQGIVFTKRRNRLPPLRARNGGSSGVVVVSLLAMLGGGIGHTLLQPLLLGLMEVSAPVVPTVFSAKSAGFLLGATLFALSAVLLPGDMGDALYSMGLRVHAMLWAVWELTVRDTRLVSKTGAMVGNLIGTIFWVVDRQRRVERSLVAGTDWIQGKLLLLQQKRKEEPIEDGTSKRRRRRRPRANVPIVTEYVEDAHHDNNNNVPPPPPPSSRTDARPPPPKSAPPPPPPDDGDEFLPPPPENPDYVPSKTTSVKHPLWMRPADYPQVPVEEAEKQRKKGPFNGVFRRQRRKNDEDLFEGWEFGSDPATNSDGKEKKRR